MPDLGAALRCHNISALRKRHFFALCRDWRFRSNVWLCLADATRAAACRASAPPAAGEAPAAEPIEPPRPKPPRRPAPPRRRAPLALPPPPLALALLPPPDHARALAVRAVERELVPIVLSFDTVFSTPIMAVAADLEPRAPIKTLNLTTMHSVRDFTHAMCATQRRTAERLRAAARVLSAEGDAGVVAWRLGMRAPLLAESSVRAILLLSHALSASCNDIYVRLPPLVGRGLSAPEAAHMAEHMHSCDALEAFAARAGALLAALRAGGGGAYLDGGAAVVEAVAAIFEAGARATQGRLDTFGARLAREPHGWRHTFFEHAEAAGVSTAHAAAAAGGWAVQLNC
jgi:hypothetical protein